MADIPIALYTLVLGGALLHAWTNIAKKKHLVEEVHEDLVTVTIMVGAGLVGFVGSFIVYGIPTIQSGFWIPFTIVAVLNILIQYLDVKALKIEDVSVVVPLASATPIFLIFMTWVILRESPSTWGRIGIGLIAVGSYFLYLDGRVVTLPRPLRRLPSQWQSKVAYWGGPWLRLFSSKGARLALLVAYLGSVAISFDKLVVTNSNPLFRTGAVFSFVALSILAYSWQQGVWRRIPKDRSTLLKLLLVGIALGGADALYSAGYLYGAAAYVGSLKRTQILWSVILAWLIWKEGSPRQRIAGGAIMFAGAALLSF